MATKKTKKQPLHNLLAAFSLLSVVVGVFFAVQKNVWPPSLTLSDAAPASCGVDRIQSLLASPDRMGFGRNTTGGAKANSFAVVTTVADDGPGSLRKIVKDYQNDNSRDALWITFDDSLRGKTITLQSSINFNKANVTIDGRGNDGKMNDIVISPAQTPKPFAMLLFWAGNAIIHGITLDGKGVHSVAMMLRRGDNYWHDHVTVKNVKTDDALSIGQCERTDSANRITISNYHPHNTSKGLLAGGGGSSLKDSFCNTIYGTLIKSNMNADDRNPRVATNNIWHLINNYSHGFRFGGTDALDSGQVLSEGNVISNANTKSDSNSGFRGTELSHPTGHIYTTNNKNVYMGKVNAGPSGSINPSNPLFPKITYPYTVMPVSQVVDYVTKNAGAENASGSLQYCSGTSTPVCGNSKQESGEQCDDGNTKNGDGCSAQCTIETVTPTPVCGNAVQESGEQCDDGNTKNGDGCSNVCEREGAGGSSHSVPTIGVVDVSGTSAVLRYSANGNPERIRVTAGTGLKTNPETGTQVSIGDLFDTGKVAMGAISSPQTISGIPRQGDTYFTVATEKNGKSLQTTYTYNSVQVHTVPDVSAGNVSNGEVFVAYTPNGNPERIRVTAGTGLKTNPETGTQVSTGDLFDTQKVGIGALASPVRITGLPNQGIVHITVATEKSGKSLQTTKTIAIVQAVNYDGVINISKLKSDGGFAYSTNQRFDFNKNIQIFEDGKALGPSGARRDRIGSKGLGRYLFKNGVLIFSASDNSDPRTNGRLYTFNWR